MGIKEKTKNIFESLKKVFHRFPLTMAIVIFITLFATIFIDSYIIDDLIIEDIFWFCLYFGTGCFLVESIFYKKDLKEIILYILFGIISVTFVVLQNFNLKNLDILWKIQICYLIILITVPIIYLYKKSNLKFEEYVVKVFTNLVKINLTYGVVAIGFLIISFIFMKLILDDILDDYDIIWRLQILLFGLFYIPNLIYSFVNFEEEISKFFKKFIKYALGSLIVTSFVIIYMYMIKIFVLREIPSNQIFRILAGLFVCGLPVWTMVQAYDDNSLWYKINKILPIAFIPFIFLQMYSIGTRINANGFTELRYICILLIIFEIVYIVMYIIKREKIYNLIIVFNVFIIISLLVPGINMYAICNKSQYNRLKIYSEKTNLSSEDKSKIYEAYRYLNKSDGGKEYIDKILRKDDIEIIESYSRNDKQEETNYNEYINVNTNCDKINIDGYKYLYNISSSSYSVEDKVDKVFGNIKFEYQNENIKIDISNKVNEYISAHNRLNYNFSNYFKNNNEIILDNDRKLILERFSLEYNKSSNEVKYYSISGYLLEK